MLQNFKTHLLVLTFFPTSILLILRSFFWLTGFAMIVDSQFFLLIRLETPIYMYFQNKNFSIIRKRFHPHFRHKRFFRQSCLKLLNVFFWNSSKIAPSKIKPQKPFRLIRHLPFFLNKLNFSLAHKFHPLVGLKMPFTLTELKKKKKWLLARRTFFAKRIRKWYKFDRKINKQKVLFTSFGGYYNILNPINKKIFKKKKNDFKLKYYYKNNLFFFLRHRIVFSHLKFVLRRYKSPRPKHLSVYKFKKPYFFLHNSWASLKNADVPLSFIYSSYKVYRKTFKAFKRLRFRKRKHLYLYLRQFSHLYKVWKIVKLKFFYFKKISYFKFYSFRTLNPCLNVLFFDRQKKHPVHSSLSPVLQLKHTFKPFKLIKLKIHKFFLFLQAKKKISKRFRFTIVPSTKTLRVLFANTRLRKFKLSKPFSLMSRFLFNEKYFVKKPINLMSKIFYSIKLKLNNNFFVNKLNLITKSTNWKNKFFQKNLLPHRLILLPEWNLPFILSTQGFLFLTNVLQSSWFSTKRPGAYRIRRIKYSFSFRNDLPKHILKKYTYTRISINSIQYFQTQQHMIDPFQIENTSILFDKNFNSGFAPFLNDSSFLNTITYRLFDTTITPLNKFQHRFHDRSHHFNHVIFRLRFKPGYMRYWRRARKALQITLKVFFKYQHQLTRYLNFFRKTAYLQFVSFAEMTIKNILVRSRFVLDEVNAKLFIDHQLIFINGWCCSNPLALTCAGDFVQLIISFKYYITFRWLLNHSLKIRKRIKKTAKRLKYLKKLENPDKKYNNQQPLWVSPYTTLFLDVAKYMEVDFFTLSIYLLYDPFFFEDSQSYHETILKPQIYNMYNWKYIT